MLDMSHMTPQIFVTSDKEYFIVTPGGILQSIRYIKINNDDGTYDVKTMTLEVPHSNDINKYFLTANCNLEPVVYGYVREICKDNKIQMLAIDLINVLILFYGNNQMLHCIQYKSENKKNHYIVEISSFISVN